MNKVYLVSAKRSPIGSFNGSLSNIKATTLGAKVVASILEETGVPAVAIDEVITGHVLTGATGQGPGRQVAITAGIPNEVPAYSINMVCGSGMKAVMNAYTNIHSGASHLVIAGGTENMSLAPYLLPGSRQGYRLGDTKVTDHLVYDALTDAYTGVHMGITAENIADRYHITREDQDTFAYHSQQKALRAIASGKFVDEIVPIEITVRRETKLFDTDEYPNQSTNVEKLSKLRPAFKKDGTVTAGNASGINDGAAYCLLASEEALAKYHLTPLAEICAIGQGGVDPQIMGLGPVPAVCDALSHAGLELKDIDLFELNEAFAAQAIGVVKELVQKGNLSYEEMENKVNLNGGAIALGHPVGASGCRILTTLAHEMKRSDVTYGVASLCIGGGMGTAIVLKKVIPI